MGLWVYGLWVYGFMVYGFIGLWVWVEGLFQEFHLDKKPWVAGAEGAGRFG